jgi:hypothetical protein
MASSGKKKTTMAKLDRERRMRERRMDKQARKDARKLAGPDAIAAEDALDSLAANDDSSLPSRPVAGVLIDA